MADFEKAQAIAEEILRENYISKPPVPVIELVRNYGHEVFEADLEPDIAGLVYLEGHIIFINKDDSDTRKAFTIAHELGHIKLHSKELEKNPDLGIMYRRPLGRKSEDDKEQEANYFAASLLVPQSMYEQILRQYKNVLPDNKIELLSVLFGVSREVISYRLKDYDFKL